MKRNAVVLFLLALLLVLGAGIQSAGAYFTTYIVAEGGRQIRLGSQSMITESVSDWTKHVTVTCAEDSEAVYVRAKAFCGSRYTLQYDDEDGLWTPGEGGYYYYDSILQPGKTTVTLHVHIDDVPDDPAEGDQFHVIVVYETTPVLYREDGTPYADWNAALTTGTSEEGGSTP